MPLAIRYTRRSLLALSCAGASRADGDGELVRAFARMYNTDFPGATKLANAYVAGNGADPMGYATQAAALLFAEMDRLGILETDFFVHDEKFADKKKENKFDPNIRDAFYAAIRQCSSRGEALVARDPRDRHALFTLAPGNALITDYMTFLQRRQIDPPTPPTTHL